MNQEVWVVLDEDGSVYIDLAAKSENEALGVIEFVRRQIESYNEFAIEPAEMPKMTVKRIA